MSKRTGFHVAASLAALASLGATQESRPTSRPAIDPDRELIEDFRVWADDHPAAAARLKRRMDADGDGRIDASEQRRAIVLLRERSAELREWARTHARPAPGGAGGEPRRERAGNQPGGETGESELQRARRLFDRADPADEAARPPARVQPRSGSGPADRRGAAPPTPARKDPPKDPPKDPDGAGAKPLPARGRQAVDPARERDGTRAPGAGNQKTLPPHKTR
jgi:hypothetical protein